MGVRGRRASRADFSWALSHWRAEAPHLVFPRAISSCKDTSCIRTETPIGSHYTFTTSLNPDSILKSRGNYFADQRPSSQSYGFSSSHVQMWELDHIEGRALKNWCFRTGVLEKILESLLESKNKPVNLKVNQSWVLFGRTDAEAQAQAPILGHLMRTADSLKKTLMLGVIEGRGWDGWMASPIQWTWTWANFILGYSQLKMLW